MVYCKFIEAIDKKIVYAIGGRSNDLTGKLVIDMDTETFELAELPKNSRVLLRHIQALIGKHLSEFRKGNYKERIAREI